MSAHLLNAWDMGNRALHTAADDLESVLWVLVWSLTCIFKEVAKISNEKSTILRLEVVFYSRRFDGILRRELLVEQSWNDEVFKNLIMDWLSISQAS